MNKNILSLTLFLLHICGVRACMYGGRETSLPASWLLRSTALSKSPSSTALSKSFSKPLCSGQQEGRHACMMDLGWVSMCHVGQVVRWVARALHLGSMSALVCIPQLRIRVKVLLQFCPLLPHVISRWPFASSTRSRWWSIRFTQIVKRSHHTTRLCDSMQQCLQSNKTKIYQLSNQ